MKVNNIETFDKNKKYIAATKQNEVWVLPEMSGKNLKDVAALNVFQKNFTLENDNNFTWEKNILFINHNLNCMNIFSVDIYNENENFNNMNFVVQDENNIKLAFPQDVISGSTKTWTIKILAINI